MLWYLKCSGKRKPNQSNKQTNKSKQKPEALDRTELWYITGSTLVSKNNNAKAFNNFDSLKLT